VAKFKERFIMDIMFHEIYPKHYKKEFIDSLNSYRYLTFDDALYSQYLYILYLQKYYPYLLEKCIVFVSTNIISNSTNQYWNTCKQAHLLSKQGVYNNYITLDQIKHLQIFVQVGLHGHNHLDIDELLKLGLSKAYQIFKQDTDEMYKCFKQYNLCNIYCTPYNKYNTLFIGYIKKVFNIITIIGEGRYDAGADYT
jgi:hypothetical protein